MAKIDKKYHELLQYILNNGRLQDDPNRKGVKRLNITKYNFEYDLRDGFPAITTKKLYWKGVVGELLWFLRGSNDIRELHKDNIHIWDKDSKAWGSPILGKIYGKQFREFGKNNFQPKPIILTDFDKEITIDYSQNKSGIVGKEFKSNNCGKFTVIKEYYIGKNLKFEVQFHNTGFVNSDITKQNITITKQVKDYYAPTVYNVATIGDADRENELYYKLKPTWEGMISRCYNKNDSNYYLYGKKGVYVENRWLIYENFLNDFTELKNAELKFKNWKDYSLDKDILGYGFYSKNTCIWANKSDQVKFSKRFNSNFKTKLSIKNSGIDQISNLIKNLKEKPLSTEHIVTAWNPAELDQMALPPCHKGFQLMVYELNLVERIRMLRQRPYDKSLEGILGDSWFPVLEKANIPKYGFDLVWEQRSVDTFLGR